MRHVGPDTTVLDDANEFSGTIGIEDGALSVVGQMFAGAGVNDLLDVDGDLVLDGEIDIIDLGGIAPGRYRLINSQGSLTDNGLVVGGAPAGFGDQIDTGIPGQIDRVVGTDTASAMALPEQNARFFRGDVVQLELTAVDGYGKRLDCDVAAGEPDFELQAFALGDHPAARMRRHVGKQRRVGVQPERAARVLEEAEIKIGTAV